MRSREKAGISNVPPVFSTADISDNTMSSGSPGGWVFPPYVDSTMTTSAVWIFSVGRVRSSGVLPRSPLKTTI